MASFEVAVNLVLSHEGGYSNRLNDPGGPTNFGITIADLKDWRHSATLTALDIKNLKVSEAKEIYKEWYWDRLHLDDLSSQNLANIILDQSVNRGAMGTVENLQMVLNKSFGSKLLIDGCMGPQTLATLNALPEKEVCVAVLLDAQLKYAAIVEAHPTQTEFLAGWLSRTHALLNMVLWASAT